MTPEKLLACSFLGSVANDFGAFGEAAEEESRQGDDCCYKQLNVEIHVCYPLFK